MFEVIAISVGILGVLVAIFAFRHESSKQSADLSVRLDTAKAELVALENEIIEIARQVKEKYTDKYVGELKGVLDDDVFQDLLTELEFSVNFSEMVGRQYMEKIVTISDANFVKTGKQDLSSEVQLASLQSSFVAAKQRLVHLTELRPVAGAMRRFLD